MLERVRSEWFFQPSLLSSFCTGFCHSSVSVSISPRVIALLLTVILLASDENLAEANVNVYGGTKFILLKVAVGMIIGQGVVEEVLFATHALEVKENDEYTADEREQRYLGNLDNLDIRKSR